MKKTILAILAMGALSCALFSQQAQAAHVTGTIEFGGAVRYKLFGNGDQSEHLVR